MKFSTDAGESRPFKRPPPEPIRVDIDPDNENDPMPDLWKGPVPIMSARLLKVLRDVGVDNIDAYVTEFYDSKGTKVESECFAINVVGKLAAADLEKSDYDEAQPDRLISMDFDSLAVSEDKARGMLLFRLAESVTTILIHENVKQAIEDAGISGVEFYYPEQWAG